jgi:peptide/nickel transport system substrate-binding protein
MDGRFGSERRLHRGTRLSRRTLLIGAMQVAAISVLQACQSQPPAGPTPTAAPQQAPAKPAAAEATPAAKAAPVVTQAANAPAAPTVAPAIPAASAGAPRRGGTLTVAVQNDWVTLDPLFASANLNGGHLIYGDWIRWDKDAKTGQWGPQPEMIAEWDLKPTEATFKLQSGITFHDGTPWDANAAKWNLDRMIFDPSSFMKAYFGGVDTSKEDKAALDQLKQTAAQTFDYASKAVEVVSPDTVKIHLARPIAPLITILSGVLQFNCPISPSAYKKLGKNDFARNPVGAGPYKFAEWKSGQSITLEKNPNYWRKALDGQPFPYIDRIQVRLIIDDSARLLEMKSGSVQFTESIQGKDIAGVQADPNLAILLTESTGNANRVIFDATNPDSKFRSLKLRQAMLTALDREAMLKTLGFGFGYVLRYLLPKGSFAYDESVPYYSYDKAKAQQLVKDAIAEDPSLAGPDGKVAITLTLIERAVDKAQAEMIKQMADTVGFNVTIESLERAAWTAKLVKTPGQPGGKFEMGTMQNQPTVDDPDAQWRRYYDTSGSFNVAHIEGDTWDKPIETAVSTYDVEERKKAYRQLEQMAYDQAWYGYLWLADFNWAFNKKLRGYREAVGSHWNLAEAWLA